MVGNYLIWLCMFLLSFDPVHFTSWDTCIPQLIGHPEFGLFATWQHSDLKIEPNCPLWLTHLEEPSIMVTVYTSFVICSVQKTGYWISTHRKSFLSHRRGCSQGTPVCIIRQLHPISLGLICRHVPPSPTQAFPMGRPVSVGGSVVMTGSDPATSCHSGQVFSVIELTSQTSGHFRPDFLIMRPCKKHPPSHGLTNC